MNNGELQKRPLKEFSQEEWEQLCDGCAKCCLHKLEDESSGELYVTNVVCRYLDTESCRCKDYANRQKNVPECVALTPANIHSIDFLPPTCAYRLLLEHKPLPQWHPLVSGQKDSVHRAGASVRGRVISEDEADDFLTHIFDQWR